MNNFALNNLGQSTACVVSGPRPTFESVAATYPKSPEFAAAMAEMQALSDWRNQQVATTTEQWLAIEKEFVARRTEIENRTNSKVLTAEFVEGIRAESGRLYKIWQANTDKALAEGYISIIAPAVPGETRVQYFCPAGTVPPPWEEKVRQGEAEGQCMLAATFPLEVRLWMQTRGWTAGKMMVEDRDLAGNVVMKERVAVCPPPGAAPMPDADTVPRDVEIVPPPDVDEAGLPYDPAAVLVFPEKEEVIAAEVAATEQLSHAEVQTIVSTPGPDRERMIDQLAERKAEEIVQRLKSDEAAKAKKEKTPWGWIAAAAAGIFAATR